MNKLMLKFLQRYKPNIATCKILNTTTDFYGVKYKFVLININNYDTNNIIHTGKCKVSIDEFNKFKKIEEAIIWE